MRTIRFRAWDNDNKQMLDVQELNFEECFYGGFTQIRTTMYSDYFDIREMPLMQYTGLKDKNGKEIYEGDIVRFPANDEYDEVNYISYECWFDSRDTFKYGWHFSRSKFHGCLCGGNSCVSMEWARQLEVIGNVHDNKELLEG